MNENDTMSLDEAINHASWYAIGRDMSPWMRRAVVETAERMVRDYHERAGGRGLTLREVCSLATDAAEWEAQW